MKYTIIILLFLAGCSGGKLCETTEYEVVVGGGSSDNTGLITKQKPQFRFACNR